MKSKITFIALSLLTFVSCENWFQETEYKQLTTRNAQIIVEENNRFAFNVFQEIALNDDSDNLMISPVSLSLALAMTYNGSETNTKLEFEELFDYGLNREELNEFNKSLIEKLSSDDDGSVMNIANSMWIEENFPIKDAYIELNEKYYDAEVITKDFSDPKTLDAINDWAADHTNDKIKKILDEINPDAKLFLINALYFNANWKYQFDLDFTLPRPFYIDENTEIEVETMSMTTNLGLCFNDYFQAVSLPYEKDKFSMIIVQPTENKSLLDVISVLNADNWASWLNDFNLQETTLIMPKFKFDFERELNDVLNALGLIDAFDTDNADFSDISDLKLYIDFVKQNTFIDVNEKGTEAAAVTTVGLTQVSSTEPIPIFFEVNKPFLFLIKENVTGSICFMGKVQKPEYN